MEKLYYILTEYHDRESLVRILGDNPYIRFVSISGVDLAGHETDEKIPVGVFLKDIDTFLNGTAVQTDGSSVILPGIAVLNNAKIDMVADRDAVWWVDYNHDYIHEETGIPVATLKIPCFLYHSGNAVDSRSILKKAMNWFEEELLSLVKKYPHSVESLGFTGEDIRSLSITSATELEFWVMSPGVGRETEELSSSQSLKEQYWARTRGSVRTALEKTLTLMEKYGLSPEMGHKEVGGVKPRLGEDRAYHGVMEQLEIDWKFSTALRSADNEMIVKYLIKDTFRREGLDVTYLAKPLENVAGSGEHTHLGVMAELKDGRKVNLFHGPCGHFMSLFGYGSVMGILKNYEVISPFVIQSIDALKRLKKGYEAPICTVTSLGVTEDVPSRNRTVLLGLIRDTENPYATRFELRSPNPHTNTYLCITTMLMTMMDGIRYALENGRSEDELLGELSKKPGEDAGYLEKERAYRSELDVFEEYSDEEREKYFGKMPETVYENFSNFIKYPEKVEVLKEGGVLTDALIESYKLFILNKWKLELTTRVLPSVTEEIRSMKILHKPDYSNDLDLARWIRVRDLRMELSKDRENNDCLMTRIRDAFRNEDYKKASDLQKVFDETLEELKNLYRTYRRNIVDF